METHVTTILRFVGVHDSHRYNHNPFRSFSCGLLSLKLGILQGSPGSTVFDLHDPWLSVTCPLWEEGHCLVIVERVKGSLEQDHPVLALAFDRDTTRTSEDVVRNWVGE